MTNKELDLYQDYIESHNRLKSDATSGLKEEIETADLLVFSDVNGCNQDIYNNLSEDNSSERFYE